MDNSSIKIKVGTLNYSTSDRAVGHEKNMQYKKGKCIYVMKRALNTHVVVALAPMCDQNHV